MKLYLLPLASLTVCLTNTAFADFDVGSNSYLWSDIKDQDTTFVFDGGSILLNIGNSVENGYSFVFSENGGNFQTANGWTFLETVFSNQGLPGGMNITTTGINMYFSTCSIDVGSILINGTGTPVFFDTSSVSLGFDQQISSNNSELVFRFGSFALDLSSFSQSLGGSPIGNWTLISGSTINWTDMNFDLFTRDSDTSYSYLDGNDFWSVSIGATSAELSYAFIPEPSSFATLFSGLGLLTAFTRRKRK